MRSAPSIRRALPTEAGVLTELALRSKAHWGYDAEFMQMARPYMVIAPEIVEHDTVFVALWAHMIGQARILGYRTVRIVSEPKAEGFYLRMGARRTGLHESEAVPGRMLPVMEFEPWPTAAPCDAATPAPPRGSQGT